MLPPHQLCRVDGCRRNWNTGNVRGQFCWEINLKLKWAYTVVDVWCCLIAIALSMYSCRMSTSLPWWPSHSLAASSPSSVSWWASSHSPTSGQFHQSFRCFMLIFIGIKTYDWSQLLSLIPKSTVLLHYLVTNPSHLFILFLVFVMVYCVFQEPPVWPKHDTQKPGAVPDVGWDRFHHWNLFGPGQGKFSSLQLHWMWKHNTAQHNRQNEEKIFWLIYSKLIPGIKYWHTKMKL